MKFVRKHKTASIIVMVFFTLFLTIAIAFGRYIKNILNNYILETKSFYFNSSILNINGKNYAITNWDGVNSYSLTIDLNNRKSEERYTKTDISYNILVSCPTTVVCTLNKTAGVIHPEDETDSYIITVTPQQNFHEGDTVVVQTSVTSVSPYQKTLSATYTIGVEKSDFSYDIVDSVNAKFLTMNFTNAISFYQVETAFAGHAVGEHISLDEYNELSTNDRNNCFSAIVTVQYDPHDLFVDMTNELFIKRLSGNGYYAEETIGGFAYVKKFTFKVPASSSSSIIFYKDDVTENYTYPIVNNTSAIQVSVNLAN